MAQKPESRAAAGVGSRGPFPLSRSVHDGGRRAGVAGVQVPRASGPRPLSRTHASTAKNQKVRGKEPLLSPLRFFFFFHFLFLKKHT